MHPRTILCIDDDPQIVRAIDRVLRLAGYVVYSTSLETATFELIKLGEPAAILLDLSMPKVSGFDILESIRGYTRENQVPVIVISGRDDLETVSRAKKLGAADFLPKPFDASVLLASLELHLGANVESKLRPIKQLGRETK